MSNFNDYLQLVIKGPIQQTVGANLFIDGHPNNSIPLFIKVDNPATISEYIGLNTLGSIEGQTNESLKTLTLYTKSSNEGVIPLYIKVEDFGVFNFVINLSISGQNQNLESSVPLFIQNNTNEITNGMPLFARGLGTSAGWYPNNNSMELYLEREFEGIAVPLNLMIMSNDQFFENFDLITNGHDTYTESLELICGGGIDNFNNTISLYIHGY